MNDDKRELGFIKRQLRSVIRPWQDDQLKTDLWPLMLHRMEERRATFGWLESVLMGLIVASLAAFPELIPLMLCHL